MGGVCGILDHAAIFRKWQSYQGVYFGKIIVPRIIPFSQFENNFWFSQSDVDVYFPCFQAPADKVTLVTVSAHGRGAWE